MNQPLIWALAAAGLAIIYAIYAMSWVLRRPGGNEAMGRIASAIQEGATAYLNRQYRVVGMIAAVLLLVLGLTLGVPTAVGFLIGAVFSTACGYLGMYVAVRGNVRTAQAASTGLNAALKVAFQAASVTGLLVVGLGLAAVA